MAPKLAILALTIAATTPAIAAEAPAGTPDTRYCMRLEAPTGSRVERVVCWTRAQWAAEDVDVDRDWATTGVRTIG